LSFFALSLSFVPPVRAQFLQTEYQQRRAALLARMPDGVLLVLGSREPVEDYLSFYQNPSFNYLTGFLEPDAALVVVKSGAATASTTFVEPRDPSREVWTGTRLGVDGVRERLGIQGRNTGELGQVLDSLAAQGLPFFVVGDFPSGDLGTEDATLTVDQQLLSALRRRHPTLIVKVVNSLVEQLRGKKSNSELAMIRKAVDITVMAQRAAMQAVAPGMNEFEIQALIEYTFRRNGADRPSFASIVGSGPNATTLHYNADNRVIGHNDIVVMDVGASYKGYAADVTRSVPASGFTRSNSGRSTASFAMRRLRPNGRPSSAPPRISCPIRLRRSSPPVSLDWA
jgi:Xaa-Pro aminopeptidase